MNFPFLGLLYSPVLLYSILFFRLFIYLYSFFQNFTIKILYFCDSGDISFCGKFNSSSPLSKQVCSILTYEYSFFICFLSYSDYNLATTHLKVAWHIFHASPFIRWTLITYLPRSATNNARNEKHFKKAKQVISMPVFSNVKYRY